MIYTLTLNPSIDYVVFLDKFEAGITNRTTGEEIYFGGKGINVSLILSELGLKNTALGFIAGFTGDAIKKGFGGENIIPDFIKLKSGNSRINVKIKAGTETEINGQGPKIEAEELEKLIKKLENVKPGDTVILSGSIPNTCPSDIYERILKLISKTEDVRVIVDATGELLVKTLKYKPFLIKPNRQELSELFGASVETAEDTEKYARKLIEMGAKNVLVSLGGEGAMLIDETGKKHTIGTANGKVLNTVGSGDSMVAGFVAGYEQTKDYGYALKLGTACGGATAFSKGIADRETIDKVLKQFI